MPEVLCQDDGCAYDAYSYMNDDCWVHIFFSKKNDVVKYPHDYSSSSVVSYTDDDTPVVVAFGGEIYI